MPDARRPRRASGGMLKMSAHVIMQNITNIPFDRIPHQSALFLSYLDSSPSVLRFYPAAPSAQGLKDARDRIRDQAFPRREIASILRRQNRDYRSGAAAMSRIDDLEQHDCVAVLTGQQVGLFGGPLYTIYKAMTAVRIAEWLNRWGTKAVPIFWMETEDHDLAEVTRRTLLYPDGSIQNVNYQEMLFEQMPACCVGSTEFPGSIVQAVQTYLDHLPDGEEKTRIGAQIRAACRPGKTFARSFAELLIGLLGDSGLILFDPHDAHAKSLVSGVFQKALSHEREIREALVHRNRELEDAGFHSQVHVLEHSTLLFYLDGGERRAVERRDRGFGLKNSERTFGPGELLEEAGRFPEKFSPNVLLRPLIQDHLFPTVVYVGGSSELAYFAQAEVLYRLYGRPMPIVWPRNSFTLLEPAVASLMERLGISLPDCFAGRPALAEKAVRHSGSRAASEVDELREQIERVLTEVRPDLEAAEATLGRALETSKRKIFQNLDRLKSRAIRVEGERNSSMPVDFVLNHCYPNHTLQERELGIYHFLARLGPSVLETLRAAIDPADFAHRVIRL